MKIGDTKYFPDGSIAHDPENTFKITEIYAFVSVDEDGNEGVLAANLGGMMMPFVCADKARVDSLRNHAEKIAHMTAKKIKLVKFTNREEIEEIK